MAAHRSWWLGFLMTGCFVGACSSSVSGPNRAPVAEAGPDQVVELNVGPVHLDGGGSFDPDGDSLSYQWELLSRPALSMVGLGAAGATTASGQVVDWQPDVVGLYVIGLVVSDTRLASQRDVVEVRVSGRPCQDESDCQNDDLWCNGWETCTEGQCVFETPACDDGDVCTQDLCNEQLDQCEHAPVADPPGQEGLDYPGTCDDGIDNDCDGLTDAAGPFRDPDCITCSEDSECADNNDCTLDTCQAGVCQHAPGNEGTACDDGLFCTQDDACVAGVCTGQARDCSQVADACHSGQCDELSSTCRAVELADGASCDDGLFCTTGDSCTGGVCGGSVRDCSAEDAECQVGVCDEGLAQCVGQAMADDSLCDDGWFCTVSERCTAGACGGGQPRDCSAAGGGCRVGVCDEQIDACTGDPRPAGTPCNDQLFCTVSDQCDGAGACQGAARDCSGLDSQCTAGRCDEGVADCVADPINEGLACDDGLFCYDQETCQAGACTGGVAHDCDDGDGCTADTCNEAGNSCDHVLVPRPGAEGPPLDANCSNGLDDDCDGFTDIADVDCQACQNDIDCDDGNSCTVNTCNNNICETAIVGDGSACDDGRYCFDNDVCTGGVCGGSPRDCSGLDDACNVGVCNDNIDQCEAQPTNNGQQCDDGLYCQVGTTCQAGACTNGSPRDCSGLSDQCNTGVCVEAGGQCEAQPDFEGQVCDDGIWCNVGESCANGVCGGGGTRDCSGAGDQCNDGACDENNRQCVAAPKAGGVPCEDGQFCSTGDACDGAGACAAGAGDPCGTECQTVCDEANNECDPDPDGTTCGSGSDTECTNPDTCLAGACQTNDEAAGAPCGDQGVECRRDDSCDGSGACVDAGFETNGTACGSSANTACTDPDSCQAGACQANDEAAGAPCGDQGVDCRVDDACDGSGACVDAGFETDGTACGSGANTECTNPDTCLAGACQVNDEAAGAPCGDQGVECRRDDSCDGSGACVDAGFETDGTACGSGANTECTNPDSCLAGACQANDEAAGAPCGDQGVDCRVDDACDGSGACVDAGFETAGTPCFGIDLEECNSSCSGGGACQDAVPAADLAVCNSGGGFCCASVCQVGWECCAAAECDDGNACTNDDCSGGGCANTCSGADCMVLDVTNPASVGAADPLAIDMCPAARDIADFVCFSDRNQEILLEEHFEAGYGVFNTSGSISLQAGAQNPNSAATWGLTGAQGVRICGNASFINVHLDTSGRQDIGFAFSIADDGLDNNETVGAYYSPDNGGTWLDMALVGDAQANPFRDHFFILPPDADDNPNLWLAFYQIAGGGWDCAFVDDVYVVDLAPLNPVQTLLSADFEAGFAPFSEVDPQGNDVNLLTDGSQVVQIDDRRNANIHTAIDTTGVDPYNRLVVEWDWRDTPDRMDNADDYALVEISFNGGTTWEQLSSTGLSYAPAGWVRYRAVLPCEALGLADLRLRFLTPAAAGSLNDNEGIRVDNVAVIEYAPGWTDWFGPMVDAGGGVYSSTVTSVTQGGATIRCRYGCGGAAIWSNPDPVTFVP